MAGFPGSEIGNSIANDMINLMAFKERAKNMLDYEVDVDYVIEKEKNVSKRKTPDWTPNLEDAFVDQEKVNKGKAAEAAVLKMFRDYYDYAYLNESNKKLQLQGKDITFGFDSWRRPFKAQIKFDEMDFKCRIDIKQLLEQSADRWIHINPYTGVYAMYDAKEMKEYLRDQGLLDKQYTYITTTKKREKFITVGFAKI